MTRIWAGPLWLVLWLVLAFALWAVGMVLLLLIGWIDHEAIRIILKVSVHITVMAIWLTVLAMILWAISP